MTATTTATQPADDQPTRALRWRREALLAGLLYAVYSIVRDLQGSASVSYHRAVTNAVKVIHVERTLGLFHEAAVQQAALQQRWLIEIANIMYGSMHFIVTIAVIVVLYRTSPPAYRRARNALAITTVLALVGFTLFPMAPPRLLPASYGFVDTLARYGTLWSFNSGPVNHLSNQYAAMPSLHFAWALWCALALFPVLPDRRHRAIALLYPALTLGVIIVTANHLFLDAIAGGAVLAAGFAIAIAAEARRERTTTSR
jgi:hypothetical protein